MGNRKYSKTKIKDGAIVGAVTLLMAASGLTGYQLVKKGQVCNCSCGEFGMVERVVDGDTLLMESGERVRIIGVDAPDEGACYYGESVEGLKKLIKGKEVRLEKDVSGIDQYGRLLRHVFLDSGDRRQDDLNVGSYLVENGFGQAINSAPDLRYRRTMISLQQEAVRKNLGIWKDCEKIKERVDGEWQKSVEPENPKCLIKGNISQHGAGRVYYLPGCDNYKTTKIDPARGEKYFCTEAEAKKAGFRKAENCRL